VRPNSQPHPPFTHVSDFIKTQLFTLIANFPAPANSNVRPAAEPTQKETEYPAHGSCFLLPSRLLGRGKNEELRARDKCDPPSFAINFIRAMLD
jgi:hypothetical protein